MADFVFPDPCLGDIKPKRVKVDDDCIMVVAAEIYGPRVWPFVMQWLWRTDFLVARRVCCDMKAACGGFLQRLFFCTRYRPR